jgi:hypothetical protein
MKLRMRAKMRAIKELRASLSRTLAKALSKLSSSSPGNGTGLLAGPAESGRTIIDIGGVAGGSTGAGRVELCSAAFGTLSAFPASVVFDVAATFS